MDSKSIYQLMFEKCPEHSRSIHYLNRYVNFIFACIEKNKDLPEDHYTEKHHILPKSMWPEFEKLHENPWNCANLTARQHFIAHRMLYRAFQNSSMQSALWIMIHTSNLRVDSKTYESLKIQKRESSSKTMSRTMKGKSTYVDSDGNRYHIHTSDPIIKELGLEHIAKGLATFKDKSGNLIRIDKEDPMVYEKELVNFLLGTKKTEEQKEAMRGRVVVKDSNGDCFAVSVSDPRYLSGDLKHVNAGTVNVIIDNTPTKITKEEFDHGGYTHQNKNKVNVIDNDGNVFKASKDDPRISTGEIEIYVSDNLRKSSSRNMTNYNNTTKGSKWMTSPSGKTKNVPQPQIDEYLKNGWEFGRKNLKKSGGLKYKACWITRKGVSKRINEDHIEDYLMDGWKRGRS